MSIDTMSKIKINLMNRIIKSLLAVFTLITFSACGLASNSNPSTQAVTIGAIAGTAVGAATGGLVGSLISNGDRTKSAILGAAIGVPVGMAVGYVYNRNKENKEIEGNNKVLVENYTEISARQRELDAYKIKVYSDVSEVTPTTERSRDY